MTSVNVVFLAEFIESMRPFKSSLIYLSRASELSLLILVPAYVMRPLFSARFHPIDDHEFAAMMTLDNSSLVESMYVAIFRMSPFADFPLNVHWRPLVWIVRAIEAHLFQEQVWMYFAFRSLLLFLLGLTVFRCGLAIAKHIRPRQDITISSRILSLSLAVMAVSSPALHDVFGRLLPGEMYTLLGIGCLSVAWWGCPPHGLRIDDVVTSAPLLFALGLVLILGGKEDGLILFPSALACFGFRHTVGHLRRDLAFFTVLSLSAIIWIAGIAALGYNLILKGARIPYQSFDDDSSGLKKIFGSILNVSRDEVLVLTFGVSVTILFVLFGVRALARFCGFLTVLLLVEFIYISSVPVTAPRYGTVQAFAVILLVLCLSQYVLKAASASRNTKAFVIVLVTLVPLALTAQNVQEFERLTRRYTLISLDWHDELTRISSLAEELAVSQILVVVDPPKESAIGRLEKTFSLGKFLRLKMRSKFDMFLGVMENEAPSADKNASRALTRAADFGYSDSAGIIYRSYRDLGNVSTLCILYSESGRDFNLREFCQRTIRFNA